MRKGRERERWDGEVERRQKGRWEEEGLDLRRRRDLERGRKGKPLKVSCAGDAPALAQRPGSPGKAGNRVKQEGDREGDRVSREEQRVGEEEEGGVAGMEEGG